MSLTPRDRKIALVIIPIVVIVAYWFLLLGPKREEAAKAGEALAAEQENRDQAKATLAQAAGARTSFGSDYAAVVRLGKAIPSKVDMPSLIIQLDRAARGTDIRFDSIKASTEAGAATAQPAASGAAKTSGEGGAAAKPGGEAQGTGTDTQTSKPAKEGSVPVGGGSPGATEGGGGGSSAPGLEDVPLEFKFGGSYFDLAAFFHRMKRFVYVANDRVAIRGRLMTIDSLKLTLPESGGSGLTAEIKATVYLSPQKEGATAGASPEGPTAEPASGSPAPASTPSSSPTATVTP